MKTETRHAAIDAILDRAFLELGEYCDAVQVMVTFDQDDQSHRANKGFGNFFARRGLAHSFIERDNAREGLDVEYSEYREDEDEL